MTLTTNGSGRASFELRCGAPISDPAGSSRGITPGQRPALRVARASSEFPLSRAVQNRLMNFQLFARGLVISTALSVAAPAAERKRGGSMLQDDFPFQGACVSAQFPARNVAMKGLAIRVGTNAAMLFDTDLLRMAAGWTGGYIDTHGVAFDGAHGAHPKIVGEQQFGCGVGPGWADAQGAFTDSRPEPFGPLDEAWCR